MQKHLSLCDVDESIISSLKTDIESLASETRKLERAWKQSLLTSAAARCHGDRRGDCQLSDNSASDETDISEECRCDATADVVCQLTDNCASNTADVSDVLDNMTSQADTHGFTQAGRSSDKALDCLCCDSAIHKTVQTNTCLHTCRELTTHVTLVKADALLSTHSARDIDCNIRDCTSTLCDVCCEFVTAAKVDKFFADPLHLAQYETCCSKLDELFRVFLSVSK